MSINAAKGVEIGAGFESVRQMGTDHRDEMTPEGFLSNNAGGILGGISSGQDVVARVAFKPTSSIRLGGHTVNKLGEATDVITKGRHDPCVGIRAVPIVEAMLAIVLMDHALRQRGQNADVSPETPVIPSMMGDWGEVYYVNTAVGALLSPRIAMTIACPGTPKRAVALVRGGAPLLQTLREILPN